MHNIDQGVHDALKVPITIISDTDIAYCTAHWMGQQKYKVPHATCRELTEEGKMFKDTLQRIIFTARFEVAMPPKCEQVLKHFHPVIVGLHYQTALLQPHYHLNNNKDNLGMNLSKHSVNECKPSLLLTVDCHYQQ